MGRRRLLPRPLGQRLQRLRKNLRFALRRPGLARSRDIRVLLLTGWPDSQEALDVAVEALVYEQDDYLEYTLNETMATLEGRVKAKPQAPK